MMNLNPALPAAVRLWREGRVAVRGRLRNPERQADESAQQPEHALRHLIGLGEHGGAGLNENVVSGVLGGLLGHIHILDA